MTRFTHHRLAIVLPISAIFMLIAANLAMAEDCQDLGAAIKSARDHFSAVITRQKRETSYATNLSVQGTPCTVFVGHRNRWYLSCYLVTDEADAAQKLYKQFRNTVTQCIEGTAHRDMGEKVTPAHRLDDIEISARSVSTWLVQVGDADDVTVEVSFSHSTDPDEDPYHASLDVKLDQ
jgi:hypothetical protein